MSTPGDRAKWRRPSRREASDLIRRLREADRLAGAPAPPPVVRREPGAPRWPNVQDYIDLGLTPEAAEAAVRRRGGNQ